MRPFKTMLKTELKLSLRGMDMVIFAIIAPLVVLVILGVTGRPLRGPDTVFWSSPSGRFPPSLSAPAASWDCRWWCRITGGNIS